MRLIAPILFGLAGVAVLVALGIWQLQRLEWKTGIIDRLEARLSAEPRPLPDTPDAVRDDFLRVALAGAVGEDELHVLTTVRPYGPGFRVIAPFETAEGRRVLVDLGYIPETMKAEGAPSGPASVTGALFWPGERDSFTPAPEIAGNIWFARDLAHMAERLGTEPLMVIAESHSLGEWPKPQRLGINLPNDHLGYAITWFSLALVWAAMSVALVLRERRGGGVVPDRGLR